MPLFSVEVTYNIVVRADSESEACNVGPRELMMSDESPNSVLATEVETLHDLPHGWDGSCLPYGERDSKDRTIAEQLKDSDPAGEKEMEEVRGRILLRLHCAPMQQLNVAHMAIEDISAQRWDDALCRLREEMDKIRSVDPILYKLIQGAS